MHLGKCQLCSATLIGGVTYFNLVHCRQNARLGLDELLQVLDTVVADSTDLDFPVQYGILYSPPTFKSRLLTSIG